MRYNQISLAVMVLGGTILTVACGGSSSSGVSSEVTVPRIEALVTQARYQVILLDAITGQRITDSLAVTFTGAAELKAADGTTLNGKTITTNDGLVALGATFSATAKDFSVLAGNRALGWVETGTRVVGDSTVTGDQTLELKLVNINKAAAVNASPASVAMAVTTATATTSGALTAPVAIVTMPKTVTNAEGVPETIGTASLKLPTGTTGKAADGTVAAAGPITVSATLYSNATVDAMSAFPGGFAATVTGAPSSALNGAAANEGAFITGGFAQFNLTDSTGKAIKTFDKPVEVGIDLPKTSLDVDGAALVPGVSQYPIWSFNDSTGEWVFEKQGVVVEKTPIDPNNYTVKFDTTHLSSWNLDFYVATCTAKINLTGRPAGDTRQLNVEIVGVTGQRFSRTGQISDSSLNLLRAPRGTKVLVRVMDGALVVGKTSFPVSLCNGSQPNPITVPVVLKPIDIGTILVETSESCADGSKKRPVPTFVVAYNGGAYFSSYTQAPDASATAARTIFRSVPAAPSYQVRAYNPRTSRYVLQSIPVTANNQSTAAFNFTVPCTSATGATGAGS